jgi:hypothetical protein
MKKERLECHMCGDSYFLTAYNSEVPGYCRAGCARAHELLKLELIHRKLAVEALLKKYAKKDPHSPYLFYNGISNKTQ